MRGIVPLAVGLLALFLASGVAVSSYNFASGAITGYATATQDSFTISLKAGWNGISSPIIEGIPFSQLNASCGVKWPGVYYWDALQGGWRGYDNVNVVLAHNKGYLVYPNAPCTLTVTGTAKTKAQAIELVTGNNLIGAVGTLSEIMGTCAGKIKGDVTQYDANSRTWVKQPLDADLNASKGYMFSVTQACTLSAPTTTTTATSTTTTSTTSSTATTSTTTTSNTTATTQPSTGGGGGGGTTTTTQPVQTTTPNMTTTSTTTVPINTTTLSQTTTSNTTTLSQTTTSAPTSPSTTTTTRPTTSTSPNVCAGADLSIKSAAVNIPDKFANATVKNIGTTKLTLGPVYVFNKDGEANSGAVAELPSGLAPKDTANIIIQSTGLKSCKDFHKLSVYYKTAGVADCPEYVQSISEAECKDVTTTTTTTLPGKTPAWPTLPDDTYTIDILPGWNLLSPNFVTLKNDCNGRPNLITAIVYDRIRKSFVEITTSSSGMESLFPGYPQDEIEYLKKSPSFFYFTFDKSNGQCELEASINDASIAQKRMKTGWNFVQVTPDMVGKTITQILGDCNANRLYGWNAVTQEWINIMGVNDAASKSDVGRSLVMKVGNDCELMSGPMQTEPAIPGTSASILP